jgi:hypothetical protein
MSDENGELDYFKRKMRHEIWVLENYLKSPVNPWSPDSGEISPMVERREKNEKLAKLRDLYERCFPDPQRVLDLLRERYRERPLS